MLLRRKLLLMGIFFEKVDNDRIDDEILSKGDRSEPEERFQTLRQSFPLRIFHFLKYRNRVRKKRFTRIKFPRKVETVSVLFNLGATRSLANLFSIRGKRGKIAIKFHFILRARARFIVGSNCLPSFQCIGGKKRTDAILKSLEIGLLVQRIGNLFTQAFKALSRDHNGRSKLDSVLFLSLPLFFLLFFFDTFVLRFH